MAAQWRENFIDRTVQCIDEEKDPIFFNITTTKAKYTTQPSSNVSFPTETVLPSSVPSTEAVNATATYRINSNSRSALDYNKNGVTARPSEMRQTEAVNTTAAVEGNRTDSNSSFSNISVNKRKGLCRGRSVTVGEGCLNLIYAVDCSKSINETGFNYSLDFVGSSVSLFDIDRGQAYVALFTYDNNVYTQLGLEKLIPLKKL